MSRDQDPGGSSEQAFAELLNGFSLDSRRRRPARREEPEPAPRAADAADPADTKPHRPVFDDEDDFGYPREEAASIVRAYSWTGGRTTSAYQLEIETLVSAVDWDYPGAMKAEYHEVINLVGRPRSVAEVAALLRLPLGVAKVLLGDMAERGLIDVHDTASTDQPDLGLMERVLAGLRRL
ncbi:DUF742 domain-containing protein [Saccharothrix syringae]|uniref:DUF742 domain-containing protein n=1 Tax=Saccharothrix syringae TaxID=103733 RepID=A0A5Q0H7Z2_SACSY|nr:DUF742 domain-containing protein [Saccharothrix syringae]QFZ22025.1 DUF742 domain-containing protein [Saccharothrix syringae]